VHAGYWKDRVGKYRILYKVDEARKMIILYDVDLENGFMGRML
jgi:mRNA-degrading endonuclease RelE of RelBE toxin-antitoxin system